MITVRLERSEDIPWVRTINRAAFEQPAEAEIVDRLRLNCPEALSLVAEEEGQIVGHLLFSPVEVETEEKIIRGMGLAPMAVRPEGQRQGIVLSGGPVYWSVTADGGEVAGPKGSGISAAGNAGLLFRPAGPVPG
jgi:hypothetical protein